MKKFINILKRFNIFLKNYWLAKPAIGARRVIFIYLSLFFILGIGVLFRDYLLIILVILGSIGLGVYFLAKLQQYGYYHRWYSKDRFRSPVEVVDFFIKPGGKVFRRERRASVMPAYQRVCETKKGKKVVFRLPKKSDADSYFRFYNNLVAEDILTREKTEKLSKVEAKERIMRKLETIKEKQAFDIFAFYKGQMIAQGAIARKRGKRSHVGELGIAVSKGFRDEGIGTKLIEELIILTKRNLRLKLITLSVFFNNLQAIRLYKKHGFKKGGRIPKGIVLQKRYVDELMMYKELK